MSTKKNDSGIMILYSLIFLTNFALGVFAGYKIGRIIQRNKDHPIYLPESKKHNINDYPFHYHLHDIREILKKSQKELFKDDK
jgi:hypothetical protein